jgi:hypothetical protein
MLKVKTDIKIFKKTEGLTKKPYWGKHCYGNLSRVKSEPL